MTSFAVDSVPGLSAAGRSRRRCGSPVHLAAALVLSLAAVVVLLATSSAFRPKLVSKGNARLRRAAASHSILPVCPPMNYNDPSCQPDRLHAPRPNITDAEVFEDMYHGFKCVQNDVVDPWASGAAERGLSVMRGTPDSSSGSMRFRCGRKGGSANGGPPSPFRMSQEMAWENGWRAMAEELLCMIAQSMYDAILSCHHGLRRGMHIHSSGYVYTWIEVMACKYVFVRHIGVSQPSRMPSPRSQSSSTIDDKELLWRLSAERRCPAGISVCAVVKNEAAYIQEWLAFHLHSGVQHFHLYLNDDQEGMMTALKPFIDVSRHTYTPRLPRRLVRYDPPTGWTDRITRYVYVHTTHKHTHTHFYHMLQAGFVTVETIADGGVQSEAYDRCLGKVKEGRLAEWLALIDLDEYLFLGDHGCLMDYLQHLDDRAALDGQLAHLLSVQPDPPRAA